MSPSNPPLLAKHLLILSTHLEKVTLQQRYPHQVFITPLIRPNSFHVITPTKNFIFSCSHCSCTFFILTSYSFYIQIMLILLLINVQYLHNVLFSFKKCKNGQIHSSSDSQYPIKKKNSKIFYPSHWEGPCPSLNAIWKTLHAVSKVKIMKKN